MHPALRHTILILCAIVAWGCDPSKKNTSEPGIQLSLNEDSLHFLQSKQARWEFIYPMLREPASLTIPQKVRSRELAFARQLYLQQAAKNTKPPLFNWSSVGPFDIGGRTRALALDRSTPGRLLAGAVSGGLWETEDNGFTWTLLTPPDQSHSISSIVQDPRPDHSHIWYYTSGEIIGNSASDPDRQANLYGSGIYKSTDNGKSWSLLEAAGAGSPTRLDTPFDYMSRIVVSPTTGTVFAAGNLTGIYRSDDEGQSFGPIDQQFGSPLPVLGGINDHRWSDIAVNSEGILVATLSSRGPDDTKTNSPGVYLSIDDGIRWFDITPSFFPQNHDRSVIAFAPSNPSRVFVFTLATGTVGEREDTRLYRFDFEELSFGSRSGSVTNLTANLPVLGEAGNIDTQSSYNMALAVKPDNQDFVLLGAHNLYRSRNGFTDAVPSRLESWIGGYDSPNNDFTLYPGHHPDMHVLLFDPQNPNTLWTASDGGIHVTTDISSSEVIQWQNRNLGFVTTQFYAVDLPQLSGDPRIAGGTQDNGTPFFRLDDISQSSRNISGGDGGKIYFGDQYAFVNQQLGSLLRLEYNNQGNPTFQNLSYVQPESATGQLFVNPFAVDPGNESVVYYAGDDVLWRHLDITSIPGNQRNNSGTDQGWERMNIPLLQPRSLSALTVSITPAHVLYYAASDTRSENVLPPVLYRIDDAASDTYIAEALALPAVPQGSYIVDIAINPEDADEILVVLSNYEIDGLYHSRDRGNSFSIVEGNLAGGNNMTGPSLRAAEIIPSSEGPIYVIGSSTGIYSARNLAGSDTIWEQEAPEALGNVVIWDLDQRPADGWIAAATHGRGIFLGSTDPAFNPFTFSEFVSLEAAYPNPFVSSTRISYNLQYNSKVNLDLFDLTGRRILSVTSSPEKEAGRHEVILNSNDLPAGIYFYSLVATPLEGPASGNQTRKTKKIALIR